MADSLAVSISWSCSEYHPPPAGMEKGAPNRSGKQLNLRATASGELYKHNGLNTPIYETLSPKAFPKGTKGTFLGNPTGTMAGVIVWKMNSRETAGD